MKKIIKSTLILTLITLIAGLALATVYEVTKKPIAAAEEQAKMDAFRAVMPEADGFETLRDEAATYEGVRIEQVVSARRGDEQLGWALTVTSSEGYGGDITVAMGVSPDGTLTGISVISQSETAGLGAKCADDEFTSQFTGITGGVVSYVKGGATAQNEVDAISGATITTDAVVSAVNAGLAYVREYYSVEGRA